MTRSARSAVLAALVVATILAGAGMGGAAGVVAADDAPAPTRVDAPSSSVAAAPEAGVAVQDVEYDRFEFEITVADDGDARWTFRYKRVLENETERRDFEAFASEFNDGETAIYRDFRDRAGRLTARAENTTGINRSMNATGFSKEAYVTGVAADNLGVVEMSFRWTNGAAEGSDGRILLGDVFAGGFYLGPNQSMVATAGEGLSIASAQPEPASRATGSVGYEGERTFGDQRPQVVFVPAATGTETGGGGAGDTASPTPTESSGGDGSGGDPGSGSDPDGGSGSGDGGDGLPLSWLALAAVALLGIGVAVAYRAGAFDRDGGAGAAGAADPSSGDTAAAGGQAESGADAGDVEPEPAVPDEELVSDEDRVVDLLEERGGRMKQVNIVEETGWSKSKVSMLLSEMEEEGTISKLRIGRENVISLSGHEPEAAGSPFDDED